MRIRALVAGAAIAAAVVAAAAAARAGSSGSWTQITHQHNGTVAALGLARTPNGTLHVLWAGPGRAPWHAVLDTQISPTGAIGSPQTVVSGWEAVHSPAAV